MGFVVMPVALGPTRLLWNRGSNVDHEKDPNLNAYTTPTSKPSLEKKTMAGYEYKEETYLDLLYSIFDRMKKD